ncbi:MAG: four helix bundle protein [Maribacter sp.]|nr:four helix bundle protein [Maribacter sp.]
MGRIEKFEDLEVWRRAREICEYVEELFLTTPLGANFSMRDQMDRSSGSIMDNIAEGFDRDGSKEFHNFLSYSKGSASELASQAYRALDSRLITQQQSEILRSKCTTVKNKIGALMHYLRNSDIKGQKFKKD